MFGRSVRVPKASMASMRTSHTVPRGLNRRTCCKCSHRRTTRLPCNCHADAARMQLVRELSNEAAQPSAISHVRVHAGVQARVRSGDGVSVYTTRQFDALGVTGRVTCVVWVGKIVRDTTFMRRVAHGSCCSWQLQTSLSCYRAQVTSNVECADTVIYSMYSMAACSIAHAPSL